MRVKSLVSIFVIALMVFGLSLSLSTQDAKAQRGVVGPPPVCLEGNDPLNGSPWVVCEADSNEAWISADDRGVFHAELICLLLGYDTIGTWSGTFGAVCGNGFNEVGKTSCLNPGTKNPQERLWDNFNAGVNARLGEPLGRRIANNVTWICVNN